MAETVNDVWEWQGVEYPSAWWQVTGTGELARRQTRFIHSQIKRNFLLMHIVM